MCKNSANARVVGHPCTLHIVLFLVGSFKHLNLPFQTRLLAFPTRFYENKGSRKPCTLHIVLFSTIITMNSLPPATLPPATLPPATFPPRGLSRPLRVRILRFLLLKWSAYDIAAECRVHPVTVYRMARNLLQYGGIRAPAVRKLGRPRRLTTADEDAVLELLLRRDGASRKRSSSGSGASAEY